MQPTALPWPASCPAGLVCTSLVPGEDQVPGCSLLCRAERQARSLFMCVVCFPFSTRAGEAVAPVPLLRCISNAAGTVPLVKVCRAFVVFVTLSSGMHLHGRCCSCHSCCLEVTYLQVQVCSCSCLSAWAATWPSTVCITATAVHCNGNNHLSAHLRISSFAQCVSLRATATVNHKYGMSSLCDLRNFNITAHARSSCLGGSRGVCQSRQ